MSFVKKTVLMSDKLITSIIKLGDNSVSMIPPDPCNVDYQEYLAWVAEGNITEEWNPEEVI